MATFQLQPGLDDVIELTEEADTLVVAEGDGSVYRVLSFDPGSDRIDISGISGVAAQDLLEGSITEPNSLLLVGSFGTIELFEVAAESLSESNFIIAGGNEPPIALDDFAITMAGTAGEIFVLDNDFDFEGDILSIIDFEATTIVGGTVSLDNNDTPDDPFDDFLTYMPAADFFGTDSFIYTISDGGATATATVDVEVVLPVEPPLVATDDFAIAPIDSAVDIDVLANDFAPDGGPEVAIASFEETTANGGTVTVNDNGTPEDPFDDLLTYSPAEGFVGTDSFSYSISNGLGTGTAEVFVEVESPVEPVLIALDDSAITMQDMPVDIDVLANDPMIADADAIAIASFDETTANGGTVTLNDLGTPDNPFDDQLTYIPAASFLGADSFSYSISNSLGTGTAEVFVDVVLPVEPPPVATDDFAETTADTAVEIDVLANDFTIGGGPEVAIASFAETTANGGTVILNDNGTPDDAFDDSLVYTPAEGFTGTDSFSYTISNALNVAEASVTVQVVQTPTTPAIAVDDFAETTLDTGVRIDVLANDTDPEGPESAIVSFEMITDNGGTVEISDGQLLYTPSAGFEGTDSFGYTIADGFGSTDTANVTVAVSSPNAPPSAIEDFAETTAGMSVNIDVLANDFNPTNNPASLSEFQEMTANGGTVIRDDNGTPTDLSDDSLIYTPAAGFVGTDSFTYTVEEFFPVGGTATVTVEVQPDDAGLVASDDTAIAQEDRPETIAILENDFNSEGRAFGLIFFDGTTANGGTVTRDNNDTPRLTDDRLVYTPAPGFTGTDSFTYSIGDARGNISTATVDVTVSSAPEPGPVAVDDRADVLTGESETIAVLENDFNPDGDPFGLIFFERTTSNGGTVTRDNNNTPRLTDDKLVYTAADGFIGEDSFTYSIGDALGNIKTAVVNVTVSEGGENEPPVAVDDFAFTAEDISVSIFVLDNDFDADGDPLEIIDFEATTASGGTVVSDEGFLVYTPGSDFFGTDSFSYSISDDRGGTDTATVTVISSGESISPPIALDDLASTEQSIPVDIFVLDNDFDEDDVDIIAIAGFPETTALGGTVTFSDNNTPDNSFDDFLTYSPPLGFTGTDSFSYTISDGLFTDSATVTVAVDPIIDDFPVPVDDVAATFVGNSVDIFVLDNDFNPSGDQIAIAEVPETTALGGTVILADNNTPDNSFDDFLIYSPAEEFTGIDSFSYTITDGELTAAATVTVTVDIIDEPFVSATDDLAETVADSPVNIDVLANDFNADTDPTGIVAFPETTVFGGTVSLDNNGTPFDLLDDFLIYTPAEGFTGTDSFSYAIGNDFLTSTATVTVTVNPLLGLPLIAEDDFAVTSDNIPVEIFVLDNDLGPDGVVELIDFEDVTGSGGIVSLDNNGTPTNLTDDYLTYLPALGFSGTDGFSYSIGDGSGQTQTGFVTVEVGSAANAPPIASDDLAETFAGIPVNIPTLDNDFDPSGNPLVTIGFQETTENGGTVTRDEDGSLIYTPPEGFTGTDGFTYNVIDSRGFTDTAFVSIVVDRIPLDLPPLILDQEVYTSGSDPVDIFVLDNEFDPRDIRREIVDFEETPEGGTVTIDDNGTPEDLTDDFLTYTPTDGFTGTDGFSYSVSDDRGLTSTAFVTVKVLPEGQSAVAIDDFTDIFLPEAGNEVNIFVLANDFSLNGDAIGLTDFDEEAENGGTVTRNDNDTPEDLTDDFLIYTPGEEFFGTDSFSYSISDGSSTDTAVVEVVNFFIINPPILPTAFAVDDRAFVIENSPANIPVLNNDFSFNESPELTDFDESTAQGGTITRNDNETPEDLTDDVLVYTPATDFVGTDSFTYSIIDDFSITSSTAVVNVIVVPAESIVSATDDEAEVIKNNPTSIFVLENDFEVDGNPLEIISFEETTVNGGTVSRESFFIPEIAAGGDARATIDDIIIDPLPPMENGEFLVYSPAEGFTGTDSFTYSISNADGITDTATVRVTVEPSAPFAGFAFDQTFENAPVTIDVLSSAFDQDRDSISLTDFEATSTFGGTVSLDDNGTPDNQTDDQLLYQPATGFTGFDDFNYSITDASGLTAVGEVSVNVLPAPAGLAAVEDFVQTIAGLPVKVGVLDNDFAIDDRPLELISFEGETENGGIVTRFENNTPDNLTDDYLVYEPGEFDSQSFGSDSFSYTIANADGSTDTGVASVSIMPILTTFANFDRAYTFADLPINIDVLANDFNVDDSTLELIDFEATGLFAEGAIAPDDKGTVDDLTDDSLIYTPPEGFIGFDEFRYSISDVAGNTATGFVSVIVDPLPEAGFAAIDDFVNTSHSEAVSIPVLDNDFDGETHLELASFEETTFNGGAIARDDKGTPDDLTDDELIYTPPAEGENDFFIFFDSFSYTVSDPDSNSTDRAIVEIEISPEPPSASDDTAETLINTAVNIPVLENDFGMGFEPGDPFSSLVISGFETTTANGGRVILDNNDSRPFDPAISDSLIYIPAPGFTGTDSFSYSISDGFRPFGASANSTALVTVTVLPETETLGF